MNAKVIKVLIADDHAIVRMGLASLLETESGISVIAQARNGQEAVQLTKKLNPDVVVMDLIMPKMDGMEATAAILASKPSVRVVILTSFGNADGIAHALEAGATGAVIKNADNDELVMAIRKAAQGERFVSREISQILSARQPVSQLTSRQGEILSALTSGLTSKEIAARLCISKEVVEEHIASLTRKLGASNRTQAVAIAIKRHLIKW